MKYQNFSPKKKSYTINFRIQIVTIYIPPKKVWSVRKDRNLFLKARATPSRRHDRRAWRHPPSPWPTTTRSPTVSQQRQKDVTSTGFSRSLRVFFQKAACVFPSLCFVCESMLLEAVSQKHKVTLYEKDSVLPSCYILFSPGLIYIYISAWKKIRLCSGTENNNVAHNAPIYLRAKWQPSIRLEQRETTNYRRSKKDQRPAKVYCERTVKYP